MFYRNRRRRGGTVRIYRGGERKIRKRVRRDFFFARKRFRSDNGPPLQRRDRIIGGRLEISLCGPADAVRATFFFWCFSTKIQPLVPSPDRLETRTLPLHAIHFFRRIIIIIIGPFFSAGLQKDTVVFYGIVLWWNDLPTYTLFVHCTRYLLIDSSTRSLYSIVPVTIRRIFTASLIFFALSYFFLLPLQKARPVESTLFTYRHCVKDKPHVRL